jgi:hypothetical protein
MTELTRERALLNRHPGLRERVAALPEFAAWLRGLRIVEVDGEAFYVVWGDQLKDHDQAIVAWSNQFRPNLFGARPAQGEQHE